MPNKSAIAVGQLSWNLIGPATFFHPATQSDSINLLLGTLDLTVWNQTYAADITLAASASSVIDLTSLTNLVGEAINFTHLKAMIITPSGAAVTFGPSGGTNPQQWFFDDTSAFITVQNGGGFIFLDPAGATGAVVSGTHKTFTITNLSGSLSTVVSIGIIGSTI